MQYIKQLLFALLRLAEKAVKIAQCNPRPVKKLLELSIWYPFFLSRS